MKIFAIILFSLLCLTPLFANGVAIVDGKNAIYLKLTKSEITVSVESQVAIIKSKQTYLNNLGSDKVIKYAFPLPESATATNLTWLLEGVLYHASIAPTPQDTTTPGPGEIDPDLKEYLGETPLYADLLQPIKKDSLLVVELSYAQLLPYAFGDVNFFFPADYSLIQTAFLDEQSLYFYLSSPRIINALQLLSGQSVDQFNNDGNEAFLLSKLYESTANENYWVKYTLSQEELGLFDFSTYIPLDELPDNLGGFLLFVAEPDPESNEQVIQKYFTLVIDRSGSMLEGSKMLQAKNAATFIVNNLNEGDKFNIVDFATSVYNFRSAHVDFTIENKTAALSYIESIIASGGTNISGAFDTAVPQFGAASDSTANIIIFFTDGLPTIGITDPDELVQHINDLVTQLETRLSIFAFGVGSNVNKQLLTLMASQNNGFADFLESSLLEEKISEFYLKIRSPVLIDTKISFSPDAVTETYPNPLPNLYQGQQMIVAGRYIEPVPITVDLSGDGAFGEQVSYSYPLNPSDSAVTKYQFLPKIWAKLKIESLLVQYYSLDPESPAAATIKQQIIEVSIGYGVISPFTSFSEPTTVEEDLEDHDTYPDRYELLGNYPNPFNSVTKIRFKINIGLNRIIKIKIYNSLGQMIRFFTVYAPKPGIYEIVWDGTQQGGGSVASGIYVYTIDFGDAILAGKMYLLK